jgi:hypothetical protein
VGGGFFMATLNSLYLEAGDGDRVGYALEYFGPHVEAGPSNQRYFSISGIKIAGYRHFGDRLAEFSTTLSGDVLLLAYNTNIGGFAFMRCRGGKVVRKLVFGYDEGDCRWEVVEGVPEVWETMMFSEEGLEDALRNSACEQGGRQPLRDRWAAHSISPGDFFPHSPDYRVEWDLDLPGAAENWNPP